MTNAHFPPNRIVGVDAARGAAMLFVCLSHFGANALVLARQDTARFAMRYIGMVASPTFMLISGIMVGLLYETRPGSFKRFARTLAGRGIFLLSIGHFLILVSVIPQTNSLDLARGFITDAIAVAILLGPLVVPRLGTTGRLCVSLGLMTATWLTMIAWTPSGPAASGLVYWLIGSLDRETIRNFPVLPWLAVYFAGSAIGGWMGRLYAAGRGTTVERGIFLIGALSACTAVAVKLGYMALRAAGVVSDGGMDALYQLTSPFQKFAPSPTYVAFYGGLGLLMTACVLVAERRAVPMIIEGLSLLGRTSLFVFLLQFYVYMTFRFIDFPMPQLWPVYFALSIAFIMICAKAWDRAGYNRWFNTLDWFRARKPSATPHPAD